MYVPNSIYVYISGMLTGFSKLFEVLQAIVCSRSAGHGLRAEVYVMVECSTSIYFAVDGMPIEMYGESWIAGLLTSDDIMLHMAGFGTT